MCWSSAEIPRGGAVGNLRVVTAFEDKQGNFSLIPTAMPPPAPAYLLHRLSYRLASEGRAVFEEAGGLADRAPTPA